MRRETPPKSTMAGSICVPKCCCSSFLFSGAGLIETTSKAALCPDAGESSASAARRQTSGPFIRHSFSLAYAPFPRQWSKSGIGRAMRPAEGPGCGRPVKLNAHSEGKPNGTGRAQVGVTRPPGPLIKRYEAGLEQYFHCDLHF